MFDDMVDAELAQQRAAAQAGRTGCSAFIQIDFLRGRLVALTTRKRWSQNQVQDRDQALFVCQCVCVSYFELGCFVASHCILFGPVFSSDQPGVGLKRAISKVFSAEDIQSSAAKHVKKSG